MPAATTSSLPSNERGAADSAPPGYVRQGNYFVQVSASAPHELPPNPEQYGPDESQPIRHRIYRRERRERPERTSYGERGERRRYYL